MCPQIPGNVISSFQYYDSSEGDGHDCVGNRKYMELDSGEYIEYTYDNRYQLDSETRKTSADVQLYKYEWSYDDAGNRLTQNKEVSGSQDSYVDYDYNNANQLTDEDRYTDSGMGTPVSYTDYTYDDAGNMTDKDEDTDADSTVEVYWDYTYNYENRQTKVEKDSSEVGEYKYSVVGNRVEREVDQTTTYQMYYDGSDCVGDYDGTSTRWYVTPSLDENLMIHTSSDYFYTQDGLGSVRELIDTSQATQNNYDYEAFGSAYNWSTSIPNRYTYTAREWDSESQTYYYRARCYYPTLGRFGSRDPLQSVNRPLLRLATIELMNFYLYVQNNAPNNIDPYGEQAYPLNTSTPFEHCCPGEEKCLESLIECVSDAFRLGKIFAEVAKVTADETKQIPATSLTALKAFDLNRNDTELLDKIYKTILQMEDYLNSEWEFECQYECTGEAENALAYSRQFDIFVTWWFSDEIKICPLFFCAAVGRRSVASLQFPGSGLGDVLGGTILHEIVHIGANIAGEEWYYGDPRYSSLTKAQRVKNPDTYVEYFTQFMLCDEAPCEAALSTEYARCSRTTNVSPIPWEQRP